MKATEISWNTAHRNPLCRLTRSPKSTSRTIARATESRLFAERCQTMLLDGDQVRHGMNGDLGFTLGEFGVPVTKGTSGVTVLTQENLHQADETACVRCGRCVDVCPMALVPTRIALAARRGYWDLTRRFHAGACMECGCCAYECPAQIPLVQLIRLGKANLAAA